MLQCEGIYENGMVTLLENIPIKERARVVVMFVAVEKPEMDYSAMDEIIGFCASERTDASVNHDAIIYELESKR
ncbi:MAG: hypothetical protein KAJ05_05260 [Candidatus Latescibacteria bacterium]|nr:hypothetical protein [Candidatus Latescibacterota bacterium]MCK5526536.1 hypothetical protein [Candidatus Latescibacterota bacterium]MCK5734332.1 hypothetical protein [Candidatus Latescibacterota bacterium]